MKLKKYCLFFVIISLSASLLNCQPAKFKLDRYVAAKLIKNSLKPNTFRIATGKFISRISVSNDYMRSREDIINFKLPGSLQYKWLEYNKITANTIKISNYRQSPHSYEFDIEIEMRPEDSTLKFLGSLVWKTAEENISPCLLNEDKPEITETIDGVSKSYICKLFDYTLIGITGIRFVSQTQAEVEYQWKYANIAKPLIALIRDFLEVKDIDLRELDKTTSGTPFMSVYGPMLRYLLLYPLDDEIKSTTATFSLYDDGWRLQYDMGGIMIQ